MRKIFKEKSIYIVLLCLFIGAGTFLRFYKADEESLWFDELGTWETSRSDIRLTKSPLNNYTFDKSVIIPPPDSVCAKVNNIIRNTEVDRIHLSLFFICTAFIRSFCGDSEVSIRLLSLISGILSIIMIYLLARLFFSDLTALISAALMSVLWFPIYYSRDARMYMLILFFSMLSSYLAIRFYFSVKKDKPQYLYLAAYLAASLFNAYLHFCSFFFTVLQSATVFLFLFLQWRKSAKSVILLISFYALQFIFILPIICYMFSVLPGFSHIPNIQWAEKPELKNFFLFINSFLNYPRDKLLLIYPEAFKKSSVFRDSLVIVFILFFLRRYDCYIKNKIPLCNMWKTIVKERKNDLFLLLWILIPSLLMFLISLIKVPLYTDRFLIFTLPPLYILIARIIAHITSRKWINIFVFSSIMLLALSDFLIIKDYYHTVPVMQYKEAIQYVAANRVKYDGAFIASDQGSFGIEYYLKKFKLEDMPCLALQNYFPQDLSQVDSQYPAAVRKEAAAFLKLYNSHEYKYMWFITFSFTQNGLSINQLEEITRFSFNNINLVLYALTY